MLDQDIDAMNQAGKYFKERADQHSKMGGPLHPDGYRYRGAQSGSSPRPTLQPRELVDPVQRSRNFLGGQGRRMIILCAS
jgi:hypothetical protein